MRISDWSSDVCSSDLAGAFDFIEKPFDDEGLLDCIRRALAATARGRSNETASAGLDGLSQLTPRDHDVLPQLIVGNPNKVISHELGISPRSVEVHPARVLENMQARHLSHLARLPLPARPHPQYP